MSADLPRPDYAHNMRLVEPNCAATRADTARIGPLQIASQHVGARLFPLASDRTYRILAYGVILLAALVSMPLLDPLYR